MSACNATENGKRKEGKLRERSKLPFGLVVGGCDQIMYQYRAEVGYYEGTAKKWHIGSPSLGKTAPVKRLACSIA